MGDVELESSINGVIEETTDRENVDTAALWEPLDMQSEELSKGQLFIIDEECGCGEKDAGLSDKVTPTENLPLKGLSDILHNIKA